MKKEDYFDQAEKLFVESRFSLVEISQEIDVSVRSLGDWKKEGDWEKKKIAYYKQHTSTNQKMLELAEKMTNNAIDNYDEDGNWIEPSKDQINKIAKLSASIPKMKEIERIKDEEKHQKKDTRSDTQKVIDLMDAKLRGEDVTE